MELNYAVIPLRPAGAAWSNVRDMLRYVSMELAEGALPDGKRYIAKEPLLERRVAQVPDRQGRDVRDGARGRHHVRRAGRAPRRRHDRLPQRHDVAPRAERRRRHPHELGPRLDPPRAVPPQAARGAVRRATRGGRAAGGGRQGVLRAARRREEAAHGARRRRREREARGPLRERRAGRDFGEPGEGRHGVRLRRVEERDGLAQEPGRYGLVPDDGARDPGIRVRRGDRCEENARDPRRPARVRLRRER